MVFSPGATNGSAHTEGALPCVQTTQVKTAPPVPPHVKAALVDWRFGVGLYLSQGIVLASQHKVLDMGRPDFTETLSRVLVGS